MHFWSINYLTECILCTTHIARISMYTFTLYTFAPKSLQSINWMKKNHKGKNTSYSKIRNQIIDFFCLLKTSWRWKPRDRFLPPGWGEWWMSLDKSMDCVICSWCEVLWLPLYGCRCGVWVEEAEFQLDMLWRLSIERASAHWLHTGGHVGYSLTLNSFNIMR